MIYASIARSVAARHVVTTAICALFSLSLAACGGGAGSGGPVGVPAGAAPLEIVTADLPAGTPGQVYGPLVLDTAGARGPLAWALVSGALPDGMALGPDGALAGTPAQFGAYAFTVEVTDDLSVASAAFVLRVKTLDVVITNGLHHGDAWSGVSVEIQVTQHKGAVSFELIENGSGGAFRQADGQTGLATYIPGNVSRAGVNDRIRVTDPITGEPSELVLSVCPDPLIEHDAEWGLSDVWHVDFALKRGDHDFGSDWHNQLARLGLRGPESTDAQGTDVDRLCDMLCRAAVLRHLNVMFERDTDGSLGDGFDISFPYDQPQSPYETGRKFMSGRINGYSVMPLSDAAGFGALGTAFVDGVDNGLHINNTPTADIDRGCFINRIVDQVIAAYGDDLALEPVNPGDTDALKALLYGDGDVGGRYLMLEHAVNGLARSVAVVVAHEIGHGVGLRHGGTTAGGIMNAVPAFDADAVHAFDTEAVEHLRTVLPGPGRTAAATTEALTATTLPEGGVCVCESR